MNSWPDLAEKFPLHFVFSCPPGFEPRPQILKRAKTANISSIESIEDPAVAMRGVDVVITDVWSQTVGSAKKGGGGKS